jgi:hypothetical protein
MKRVYDSHGSPPNPPALVLMLTCSLPFLTVAPKNSFRNEASGDPATQCFISRGVPSVREEGEVMAELQGAIEGEDFAWTRLRPAEGGLYEDTFSVFLVQVKSESDIGTRLLYDPLAVLREKIPEMGIGEDVQAIVHRVNADIAVRRVHRTEVWFVYPPQPSVASSRQTAVGVQYKYSEPQG